MLLPQILLLAVLAILFRLVGRSAFGPGITRWLVFAASVLCIYWLQPALPVRYLDFWLPTVLLALTAAGWLLTVQAGRSTALSRQDIAALLVMIGLVLLVGLTRYFGAGDWFTPSRPPASEQILIALVGLGLAWIALLLAQKRAGVLPKLLAGGVVVLIALLVLYKTPGVSTALASWLRGLNGQNPALATALDIRWLGFSYACFRLIHTLRDRQLGRAAAVNLQTYASYVLFFPAFVAGPIDRLERFAKDFCAPGDPARLVDDWTEAGRRLVLGLFKKFVVADTLALIALNPANALQVQGAGWMWLLLYVYALQIFFDFSGYTDIAIGLGRLLGVKLPENFAAPYLKPNLTQFWNSWHMSLTTWFRGYFFNPLVRWLRGNKGISPVTILLVTQVSTMLLIGLWHGVTWSFVLWGLWHGLGLFVQNRWTDLTRPWFAARSFSPGQQRALQIVSIVCTFHYVALGWIWFVMPSAESALRVFGKLVGLGV